MTKRWFVRHPELVEEIRCDLASQFASLHLYIEKGVAQVRGTFPVRDPSGAILDEYLVEIELPSHYPDELPVLREVGERIPRRSERHVNPKDGSACVLLPDSRWESFPVGAPFIEYLTGPVHNFFLGQTLVDAGGEWPFGEWGHGAHGILEYYKNLIGAESEGAVSQFVWVLSRDEVRDHWDCPCGSGRKIRDCCAEKIRDLRTKISRRVAARSLRHLDTQDAQYGRQPRRRRASRGRR